MTQIDSQFMIMKGTKDGLIIYLDDLCSYNELCKALHKDAAKYDPNENQLVSVTVHTGNRYLNEEHQEEIKNIFRKNHNFVIEKFESHLIPKDDIQVLIDEASMEKMSGVIRSGQSVYAPGDFLLIGDVNPGGEILAGGNIYVLGSLRGVAKAGVHGNQRAIVVAANFMPLQVYIANVMARSDHSIENESSSLTFAYLNEKEQIEILGLQEFMSNRNRILGKQGGLS